MSGENVGGQGCEDPRGTDDCPDCGGYGWKAGGFRCEHKEAKMATSDDMPDAIYAVTTRTGDIVANRTRIEDRDVQYTRTSTIRETVDEAMVELNRASMQSFHTETLRFVDKAVAKLKRLREGL
tara:strand:+ start:3760 stop:4131 length:372 start_codon:yes stop_codon:yes gene_type:complete